MKYPTNIKKEYHKYVNHANRGMDLEDLINKANKYYLDIDKALIYKKPTPIGISKVSDNVITKSYFKEQSTLDYNGIYKGYYIDFDAKVTNSKTSFPLANIHSHQLEHIKRVINHKGIAFLIIMINDEVYLLDGKVLLNFINNNDRKSIPYNYIVDNALKINLKINPTLDYLSVVDILIKERNKNGDK